MVGTWWAHGAHMVVHLKHRHMVGRSPPSLRTLPAQPARLGTLYSRDVTACQMDMLPTSSAVTSRFAPRDFSVLCLQSQV